MKRKFLNAFLVSSMLVTSSGFPVMAQVEESVSSEEDSAVEQGKIGTAEWTLDSTGLLTIGEGEFTVAEGEDPEVSFKEFASSIKRIDGTASFKITGSMKDMLSNLDNLTTADLSGWDTSAVTSMERLFEYDFSLVSVNIKNWNTGSVESMIRMFNECTALESLDFSNWNTSTLKYIYYGFAGCKNLETLDMSGWDLSSLANMYQLCFRDTKLTTVRMGTSEKPVLQNAAEAFGGCYALKYLDISRLNATQAICDSVISATPDTILYSSLSADLLSGDFDQSGWYQNNEGPCTISELPDPGQASSIALTRSQAEPVRLNFETVTVSGVESEYEYTGEAIQPAVTVMKDDTRLEEGRDYKVEYSNTTGPGIGSVQITGTGYYTGLLVISFDIKKAEPEPEPGPVIETVVMHRLYNPNSGEHFYTSSDKEKNDLIKAGWRFEGQAWKAPSKGNPVYRLYNPNAGDHHYTLHESERDVLIKAGWRYEGIGWYSDENESVPLYRLYNPNAAAGAHHYTTSEKERDDLVKVGWRDEQIAWYGVK